MALNLFKWKNNDQSHNKDKNKQKLSIYGLQFVKIRRESKRKKLENQNLGDIQIKDSIIKSPWTVRTLSHPHFVLSAPVLVSLGVENVRLMRHESCVDTLQMAQIPDRKSGKHEEHVLYVDMVDTKMCVTMKKCGTVEVQGFCSS